MCVRECEIETARKGVGVGVFASVCVCEIELVAFVKDDIMTHICWNTLQHNTSMLQCVAVGGICHTAPHCSTLQHICIVLQCVAGYMCVCVCDRVRDICRVRIAEDEIRTMCLRTLQMSRTLSHTHSSTIRYGRCASCTTLDDRVDYIM